MQVGQKTIAAFIVSTYKLVVCVLFHRRHYRHHMIGLLDCEVQ